LVTLSAGLEGCGPSAHPEAAVASVAAPKTQPLFRRGDRVAWVGSSSTKFNIWPRTVEFLFRTRHPELELSFRNFGVAGASFATGVQKLDGWLDEFHPDVVFFNYGVNDASAGRSGSPDFRINMERCVAKVHGRKGRVVLITPQAADARKAGPRAAARRALYAETMLAYGREKGWTVIDTHHPLDALQRAAQERDSSYTILADSIHLTRPASVAWGFFVFDRLDLPFVSSAATLTVDGHVAATDRCTIRDVKAGGNTIAFTRIDNVLPILPPGPLPPRLGVPLESQSRYLLAIVGLTHGEYEIRCEDQPIGSASAEALAAGVNLNSLLLDSDRPAPWARLAQELWEGRSFDRIGHTEWRFVVRRQ
jgi:hypothetical protein